MLVPVDTLTALLAGGDAVSLLPGVLGQQTVAALRARGNRCSARGGDDVSETAVQQEALRDEGGSDGSAAEDSIAAERGSSVPVRQTLTADMAPDEPTEVGG
ncbi:hypothetical protein GCM10010174_61950 [Kutzneria viridogrisea]